MKGTCGAERKLFVLMNGNADTAKTTARILAGPGDFLDRRKVDATRNATTLAHATLLFVLEFGCGDELSFGTFKHVLCDEGWHASPDFADCIFRQIERAERYSLKEHRWVSNPDRNPAPDSPSIMEYEKVRALGPIAKLDAFEHLLERVKRLERCVGFEALSAAILAHYFCRRIDLGRSCPVGKNACGYYVNARRKAARVLAASIDQAEADGGDPSKEELRAYEKLYGCRYFSLRPMPSPCKGFADKWRPRVMAECAYCPVLADILEPAWDPNGVERGKRRSFDLG